MNITCDVIRDLLPLYADDVCSPGSRELVETHLYSCRDCAGELRMMKADLPGVPLAEVDSAKAAGKAWKKNKVRSLILGLLIAALIGGLWYGLTVPNIVPVGEEHLQVDALYRMEEGTFYVELTVTDGFKHNFIRYRMEDGRFYITPMQPIITSPEDPDFVERKNSGWHVVGHRECTALYVGWGEDATLIWEEGMELPPAPADIEAEYAELTGK